MLDATVSQSTAVLAQSKGFVNEPCHCGGFPECICDQVRAQSKKVYEPTQVMLQRWLREEAGLNAYVLPRHTVMASSQLFTYTFHVVELTQNIYFSDGMPVNPTFNTWEEALEAALVQALNRTDKVKVTIDMSRYKPTDKATFTGRVFSGRLFGMQVREESGIDRIASMGATIVVQFPEDTFTVSPNFLEELFHGVYNELGMTKFNERIEFAKNNKLGFDISDNMLLALERLSRGM